MFPKWQKSDQDQIVKGEGQTEKPVDNLSLQDAVPIFNSSENSRGYFMVSCANDFTKKMARFPEWLRSHAQNVVAEWATKIEKIF